jgi:hypothetical protein
MQINFGGIPTAEAQRTLELFAREVMPALGPSAADGSRGRQQEAGVPERR